MAVNTILYSLPSNYSKDLNSICIIHSVLQEVSEDQLRALEKQRQEHKLGILLVAISILFILCQSFKMIPDLYEIMYCESIANCESTPFVTFWSVRLWNLKMVGPKMQAFCSRINMLKGFFLKQCYNEL